MVDEEDRRQRGQEGEDVASISAPAPVSVGLEDPTELIDCHQKVSSYEMIAAGKNNHHRHPWDDGQNSTKDQCNSAIRSDDEYSKGEKKSSLPPPSSSLQSSSSSSLSSSTSSSSSLCSVRTQQRQFIALMFFLGGSSLYLILAVDNLFNPLLECDNGDIVITDGGVYECEEDDVGNYDGSDDDDDGGALDNYEKAWYAIVLVVGMVNYFLNGCMDTKLSTSLVPSLFSMQEPRPRTIAQVLERVNGSLFALAAVFEFISEWPIFNWFVVDTDCHDGNIISRIGILLPSLSISSSVQTIMFSMGLLVGNQPKGKRMMVQGRVFVSKGTMRMMNKIQIICFFLATHTAVLNAILTLYFDYPKYVTSTFQTWKRRLLAVFSTPTASTTATSTTTSSKTGQDYYSSYYHWSTEERTALAGDILFLLVAIFDLITSYLVMTTSSFTLDVLGLVSAILWFVDAIVYISADEYFLETIVPTAANQIHRLRRIIIITFNSRRPQQEDDREGQKNFPPKNIIFLQNNMKMSTSYTTTTISSSKSNNSLMTTTGNDKRALAQQEKKKRE